MEKNETILVVDDVVSNRHLVKEILSINDYVVLEAKDTKDAVRICAEYAEPIHLLITDLVMPELNGMQLAKALRPVRPDMKILYISGYFTDVNLQIEVWDKVADFIAKPFSPNALLAKVKETLTSPRADSEA